MHAVFSDPVPVAWFPTLLWDFPICGELDLFSLNIFNLKKKASKKSQRQQKKKKKQQQS